jgi:hypothetical protein
MFDQKEDGIQDIASMSAILKSVKTQNKGVKRT